MSPYHRNKGQVADASHPALVPYSAEWHLHVGRKVQPTVTKERDQGVMRAAEDRRLERVSAAECKDFRGRIQISRQPNSNLDLR